MHVGIDLGTTNSVLATFDGTTLSVVPNAVGEVLTPSVVRIDARGTELVGRRAFRFLETDPANTRGEFKRLMGTEEPLRFEASGQTFLPQQLSAKVLASLLADAEAVLGYRPAAVVVSTPALFELPQNHATMKAGKLAGLAEVTLIQEPIASAIAAGWRADAEGFWLVYDLGGGTLDVSLLETRDGWLRVVDHGGDNFLGGKDFDNALTDWALARLAVATGLPALSRTNPAHRRALSKLKAACEQAKIDLSRLDRTSIVCAEVFNDPDGNPVDADLPVSRVELEGLVVPLIERSLDVCRTVLEKNRLGVDAVGRVVFVGGPTLMPALRERVGGFLRRPGGGGDRSDDHRGPRRGPLRRHRRAGGAAGGAGGPQRLGGAGGVPGGDGGHRAVRGGALPAGEGGGDAHRRADRARGRGLRQRRRRGERGRGVRDPASPRAAPPEPLFAAVQFEVEPFRGHNFASFPRKLDTPLAEMERWLQLRLSLRRLLASNAEALPTAWYNRLRLAACNWPVYLLQTHGPAAFWACREMSAWCEALAREVDDQEIVKLSHGNSQVGRSRFFRR